MSDSVPKMPAIGEIVAGRYRILSRLGSGGMGVVFMAEQLAVGNKLAIKFLDPRPTGDESRIARFLREAKVGLQVQHPGATQILDLGRDESMRLYLCFELVEGEDLRALVRREGRLRIGEARSIAVQVAQVLSFAHERNVVHRDVKPENIRVRRDIAGPHVKVLDFGIARLLKDTGIRLTGEGMMAGTPRYMAPEQVKDGTIDGRTDQYALGLVLFEMLTGVTAIGGKNLTQTLTHQLQTLVPPLAWADPALANPDIDAFIAKASAKSSDERFASMAEFISALQAIQVDEAAWPGPPAVLPKDLHVAIPTRNARTPEEPEVHLSDTKVKAPSQTGPDTRLEATTDPNREAIPRPGPKQVEKMEQPLDADLPGTVKYPVVGKMGPPITEKFPSLGGSPEPKTQLVEPALKLGPPVTVHDSLDRQTVVISDIPETRVGVVALGPPLTEPPSAPKAPASEKPSVAVQPAVAQKNQNKTGWSRWLIWAVFVVLAGALVAVALLTHFLQ